MSSKQQETPGGIVARLREAAGLTPYALARRAGVAPEIVYRLESGERSASLETMRSLFRALGASLALLDLPADE